MVERAEMGAEVPQVSFSRIDAHGEAIPFEQTRPRREHAWREEDLWGEGAS